MFVMISPQPIGNILGTEHTEFEKPGLHLHTSLALLQSLSSVLHVTFVEANGTVHFPGEVLAVQ